MPGLNVISDQALTAGLRNTFATTYDPQYKGVIDRMGRIADIDLPSDKRKELYAYFETAPHLKLWRRGDAIPADLFEAIGFSATNKNFAMKIQWHVDDRADDQIGKLFGRAKQLAVNANLALERGIFDIILGTTSFIDVVPNAPDGAALYSATDGDSNDRFGVSGGNVISSPAGVAAPSDVRQDFWNAAERLLRFQDKKGQPLVDASLAEDVVILYNIQNSEVFREAFAQGRTLGLGTAGATGVGAAVTNTILESGYRIQLVGTQRITDNDWYLFFPNIVPKPIFSQRRQAIEDRIWTMQNSDRARDFDVEAYGVKERRGYAPALPYGTVKVDNS